MIRTSLVLCFLVCCLIALSGCSSSSYGGSGQSSTPPNALPMISTQPASASVNVGQVATFSVVASGSGTLTYQWYRSGTAISGATTSVYTTAATTTADNGATFSVTVTNAAGTVTSNSATLTAAVASGNPIIASQDWANAAVAAVNGGVSALVQASNAGQFLAGPTGAPAPAAVQRSFFSHQASSSTFTISCATLSTTGFSGSGTVTDVITVDSTAGTFSDQTTYNACMWTEGVGPYVYDTFTYDGTQSTTGSISLAGTTFQFGGSWNLTVKHTRCCLLDQSPQTESYTITGSYSCTSNGSSLNCQYNLGNYAIGNNLSVSLSGNTTTVAQATASTTVTGSAGPVNISYSNWTYDSSLGYATSGTATMTDSNGDTATITANGNNSYTVVAVIQGATSTYQVTG